MPLNKAQRFRIETAGDLECVTIAETYNLLSDVFGSYTFSVSGDAGQQIVCFQSAANQAVFFLKINEFIAQASDVYTAEPALRNLSLLDAGQWLSTRYPDETAAAQMDEALKNLAAFLNRRLEVRFWCGELARHITLEESFQGILRFQANFSKHTLLKLSAEIGRLLDACERKNCGLTPAEAVAAKDEFAKHIDGMMDYHATELAEMLGRYLLAFYWFVRNRFEQAPTNNLDLIRKPADLSNELFGDLYSSAIVSLARWTEKRIRDYVPDTAPSLRRMYPQHRGGS